MTTFNELYVLVREQTQTTIEELPDTTINPWLRQAFQRTIAAENEWPFYQQNWTAVQLAGETNLTLPGDVNPPQLISVLDDRNVRLRQIPVETGEDVYGYQGVTTLAYPGEYSIWGDHLILWPQMIAATDRTFGLRGYRLPRPWATILPSEEPDCDYRLHMALAHYATALAYAQQEDEVLETTYMDRWQRDVEMARQAIMEVPQHRPLTMGPRYRHSGQPGRPFVITPPGGP